MTKYLLLIVALFLVGCMANATAHVYENKETGELLYCSNEQEGELQDFEYKGTAEVAESEIRLCELEEA